MTLQSIERFPIFPSSVVVVIPRGREHLLEHDKVTGSRLPIRVVSSEPSEDSWITTGFRVLAPAVDVLIFAAEGTIFENVYLDRVRSRFADWEDLVGLVEIVSELIEVGSAAELMNSDPAPARRDAGLHAFMRRWLRARSLMPTVLSLRAAASRGLNFAAGSQFFDWIAQALILDQLRARGRTAVEFGKDVRGWRFSVERRSGFEFGYAVYDRLARIHECTSNFRSPGPTHLNPRIEKARLFSEQIVQYALSTSTKRHGITIVNGMLAARRDLKARAHRMRREIRDLA
jgi:hypothetical protein